MISDQTNNKYTKMLPSFFEMGAPSRNICQGNTIILWCYLSIGISTIDKDIGSMHTLF